MNLDRQALTNTNGTVRVPIWGKTEEIPLLVHLYIRKEKEEVNRSQLFCRPFLQAVLVYKFRIQPRDGSARR